MLPTPIIATHYTNNPPHPTPHHTYTCTHVRYTAQLSPLRQLARVMASCAS